MNELELLLEKSENILKDLRGNIPTMTALRALSFKLREVADCIDSNTNQIFRELISKKEKLKEQLNQLGAEERELIVNLSSAELRKQTYSSSSREHAIIGLQIDDMQHKLSAVRNKIKDTEQELEELEDK